MFRRAIALNAVRGSQRLMQVIQRGFAYKAGQEPAVFVSSDTKVICQGITGKQVSVTHSTFCIFLSNSGSTHWLTVLNSPYVGHIPYFAGN